MKKRETEGIVLEVRGNNALVRPTNHTGCDSSYCCQGAGVKKVDVEMVNRIQARAGDKVVFEAKEGHMLIAAFIVYILPLALTFGGAAGGYQLSAWVRMNAVSLAVGGGILCFALSVLIIKTTNNFAAQNTSLKPVIIRKSAG
ncbi:MAG: SoxR reducing system RseC family protein [Peptococcaceae bacterium]|jgi:sigma-E factor negative regulatory protein RseC|nr:SoxR reducing system RseC family protein [Peptococcaceae bacterium]